VKMTRDDLREGVSALGSRGQSRLMLEDLSDAGQTPFASWWQSFIRGSALQDNAADAPLTVVDLFSGSGGFGLGIELAARSFGRRAEFRCVVDADAAGMSVYARSLPVRRALHESVAATVDYRVRQRNGDTRFAYEPQILHPDLAREVGVDLLIAGPPCQGHSNLNNHTRRNDPRNDLYVATVAVAVALKAKAVIIENVPSVIRSHGEVVRIARELLTGAGYDVTEAVLKADSLGGAQTRARFFMIATCGTHGAKAQLESLEAWAGANCRDACPVTWAINDLAGLEGAGTFDTAPQATADNLRRIKWLFENDAHDLANSERPDCHQDGTTYTAVYGRMHADRPAPTITTGIGTPGQGRFIHPYLPRLVTPHEAARIQGFPDWYQFVEGSTSPSRKLLAKWIGDAVPPLLGMSAAQVALASVFDKAPELPWE
jgi:DNA (cytosine-5)-methyltransferase 1